MVAKLRDEVKAENFITTLGCTRTRNFLTFCSCFFELSPSHGVVTKSMSMARSSLILGMNWCCLAMFAFIGNRLLKDHRSLAVFV
jgi:hypothetical protein